MVPNLQEVPTRPLVHPEGPEDRLNLVEGRGATFPGPVLLFEERGLSREVPFVRGISKVPQPHEGRR